jgi:hypothetical protein
MNDARQLITEMRNAIDDAITQHIYNEDNEPIPADCSYTALVRRADTFLALPDAVSRVLTMELASSLREVAELAATRLESAADDGDAADLRAALQWLLDDMHAAGNTHGADGIVLFDSVDNAARALVAAGAALAWFPATASPTSPPAGADNTLALPTVESENAKLDRTVREILNRAQDAGIYDGTFESAQQYLVAAGQQWSPKLAFAVHRVIAPKPAADCAAS